MNRAEKDHYMEAMDAVGAAAPHADLSIWGLFWAADWIVKSVMIGLLGASTARRDVWRCGRAAARLRERIARAERRRNMR